MPRIDSTPRAIARAVLVVVAVVLAPLRPLAAAQADQLADHRRLHRGRRGGAGQLPPAPHEARARDRARLPRRCILIPIGLGALLIPPLVSEVEDLADNAPSTPRTSRSTSRRTRRSTTSTTTTTSPTKLEEEAEKLPEKIPRRRRRARRHRGRRRQLGLRRGDDPDPQHLHGRRRAALGRASFVETQRPEHAERIERTLRRIANAVGNYVGGALLQATIAGVHRLHRAHRSSGSRSRGRSRCSSSSST